MPPKENEVELSELIALEEQIEDLKDALYDARKLLKYAIPIPEGATNGDMIKAMFPNAQIDYHEKSDLVDDYVTVFIKGCDTCQDYSYGWWNAPYKKEVEDGYNNE